MGGEKHIANFDDESGRGSPPRGRGKVGLLSAGLHDLGITPAWAGKRIQKGGVTNGIEDHPRVGGEKEGRRMKKIKNQGSPPRGRGKGLACFLLLALRGITPAWAGKSKFGIIKGSICWDHPRVGGEKF